MLQEDPCTPAKKHHPRCRRKMELTSEEGGKGSWGQCVLISSTDVPWWQPHPPSGQGYPTCLWIVEPLLHLMKIYFTNCKVLYKWEVYTRQEKGQCSSCRILNKTAHFCSTKKKKKGLSICFLSPESKAFVLRWLILKEKRNVHGGVRECLDVV